MCIRDSVEAMCGAGAITRRMAESLYVGMLTDKGNFAFSFLTPELFRAVAVLVEKGISIPDIHNSVYNAYTEAVSYTHLLFCGAAVKFSEIGGTLSEGRAKKY